METYFSKFEKDGKTYRVMDLADSATATLPSMKQYIKEQLESKFKVELGRNWTDDLLPDPILESMITYADKLGNRMRSRFGKDCEFYPELRITGKIQNVSSQSGPEYLMGVIDLLVVDGSGQVHIFDYKTSTKPYNEYNSAKKLAFYYQLATYGKLLKNYGLEYRTAKMGILPITLKNFELEN